MFCHSSQKITEKERQELIQNLEKHIAYAEAMRESAQNLIAIARTGESERDDASVKELDDEALLQDAKRDEASWTEVIKKLQDELLQLAQFFPPDYLIRSLRLRYNKSNNQQADEKMAGNDNTPPSSSAAAPVLAKKSRAEYFVFSPPDIERARLNTLIFVKEARKDLEKIEDALETAADAMAKCRAELEKVAQSIYSFEEKNSKYVDLDKLTEEYFGGNGMLEAKSATPEEDAIKRQYFELLRAEGVLGAQYHQLAKRVEKLEQDWHYALRLPLAEDEAPTNSNKRKQPDPGSSSTAAVMSAVTPAAKKKEAVSSPPAKKGRFSTPLAIASRAAPDIVPMETVEYDATPTPSVRS